MRHTSEADQQAESCLWMKSCKAWQTCCIWEWLHPFVSACGVTLPSRAYTCDLLQARPPFSVPHACPSHHPHTCCASAPTCMNLAKYRRRECVQCVLQSPWSFRVAGSGQCCHPCWAVVLLVLRNLHYYALASFCGGQCIKPGGRVKTQKRQLLCLFSQTRLHKSSEV